MGKKLTLIVIPTLKLMPFYYFIIYLNGKLKQDQVPDLAITNVFTGSLTDRTNLVNNSTIESGDVFIDTAGTGDTYMNNGGGHNWITSTNRSAPSTFIGLGDVTAGSIQNNELVYGTSSGLTFTTSQIEINGGGIKCGQMNPSQHKTTNLGDGSNRWNQVHVKNLNNGTNLQLPNTAGSNGQFLKTDGAGVMSWASVTSASGEGVLTSTQNVAKVKFTHPSGALQNVEVLPTIPTNPVTRVPLTGMNGTLSWTFPVQEVGTNLWMTPTGGDITVGTSVMNHKAWQHYSNAASNGATLGRVLWQGKVLSGGNQLDQEHMRDIHKIGIATQNADYSYTEHWKRDNGTWKKSLCVGASGNSQADVTVNDTLQTTNLRFSGNVSDIQTKVYPNECLTGASESGGVITFTRPHGLAPVTVTLPSGGGGGGGSVNGVSNAGASGVSLHSGVSNNDIKLKTLTGNNLNISENDNITTIENNIIDDSSTANNKTFSCSHLNSNFLNKNKNKSSTSQIAQKYIIVYI